MNTITDDQGKRYELTPFFDHDTQTAGCILVPISEAEYQAAISGE